MRLLLCDDEKMLSHVLSVLLKKNNYTVDCAYDGEEALDFITSSSYDAIILDVMMPKLDGLRATLKIREDNMKKAVKGGFLNATEVADYLVNKNVAFRDAHGIVGQIVIYCEDNEKAIEDLSLEELKRFSEVFDEDIYDFIDYENILNKGIKKNLK